MESEELIEERKKKIKALIKGSDKLAILGIVALAFVIRIYYFFVTKDQTLWWDALAYASMAKTNFLYGVSLSEASMSVFNEIMIRPPLLPLLWSFLMKFSFTELMSKFVLQIVPSVLSVFVIYLIGKEVYDKKTALIAAAIFAVSWIHLFYSMRMLTNISALFFLLLSIYYFFKSSEELKQKYFALAIFFLSITILLRYPYGLVGFVYLIFLVFTQKLNFLKKKSFWKGGILGVTPLILFFLINFIKWGHFFPAVKTYILTAQEKPAYAYYTLGFFEHILQTPFFWIFLLGLAVTLMHLFFGFGVIKKSSKLKFHMFSILLLLTNLIFLIFLLKASEDRYLFINFSSIIFPTAIGIVFIQDLIKKYSKQIATGFVIFILAWGAYSQLTFGDEMIDSKKHSFSQMKETFLWIKSNTPEDAVILGEGVDFYSIYYADRTPMSWPKESFYAKVYSDIVPQAWLDMRSDLTDYKVEADYIVQDVFHGNEQFITDYLIEIQPQLEPVYAVFIDPERTQAAVVVYKYHEEIPI